MARPVTCNIKIKPKKTYHLSEETIGLMERCHIDVEHSLGKHIEVTPFVNALIAVATDHMDEIANRFRPMEHQQR